MSASGSIQMDNCASCKVVSIGTFKIKMFDGVARTLGEVRHVQDLWKNLISLDTLNTHGFGYKSEGGAMKVTKGAMEVMKELKLSENIYRLLDIMIVGGAAAIEVESDSIVL